MSAAAIARAGYPDSTELLQLSLRLLSRLSRDDREALIEHAICLCDLEDGDSDFEPDYDGEDDGSAEPQETCAITSRLAQSGQSDIRPCRTQIL